MKNYTVDDIVKMKQKCDKLAEKETTIGMFNRLLFAYFILFGTLAWHKYDMISTPIDDIIRIGADFYGAIVLMDTLAAGDIKDKIEEKIEKIYKEKGPVFEAEVYENYNKVKKLKK